MATQRFAQHFAVYAGADILGKGIGLLLSPITTRLLTPEQFGVYALLVSAVGMWTWVQYAGMDTAYPFFLAREAEEPGRRQVLVTANVVATLTCAALWSIAWMVALSTSMVSEYSHLNRIELVVFVLGIGPTGLATWYLYVLRFMHAAWSFARLTLLSRVMGLGLAILAMAWVTPPWRLAVLLGVSAVADATGCVLALLDFRGRRAWPYDRGDYKPALARRMLAYGLVLVPASVTYSGFYVSGRFLVGWLAGPAEVAILALAGGLSSGVLMIKGWFSLVWSPYVVDWVATRRPEQYVPRMQTAATGLGIVLFTAASVATVWSDWIVSLLYPEYYARTAALVPLLIIGGACAVLTVVANITAIIADRPRISLVVVAMGLSANLVTGVLTIPKWGASGAVAGIVIGEAVILGTWIVLGKMILRNLDLHWARIGVIGAGSVLFVLLYRPGVWGAGGLEERLGVTLGLVLIGLSLVWRFRPTMGWNEILSWSGRDVVA